METLLWPTSLRGQELPVEAKLRFRAKVIYPGASEQCPFPPNVTFPSYLQNPDNATCHGCRERIPVVVLVFLSDLCAPSQEEDKRFRKVCVMDAGPQLYSVGEVSRRGEGYTWHTVAAT